MSTKNLMTSQDPVWENAPDEMFEISRKLEQLREELKLLWTNGEYLKGQPLHKALEMTEYEFQTYEKTPYKVVMNADVDDYRLSYIQRQGKVWRDAPLEMIHLKEKLEQLRFRLSYLWHNATYSNGKELHEALFMSRREYNEWAKNPFEIL